MIGRESRERERKEKEIEGREGGRQSGGINGRCSVDDGRNNAKRVKTKASDVSAV